MEVFIRFFRKNDEKGEICFRFRRGLLLVVGRANFSGSESSLRMWRAGVEDSAIIGDDSVMVGGLTGVVGSVGKVGSTSGASGGFGFCCSWGTSAAG